MSSLQIYPLDLSNSIKQSTIYRSAKSICEILKNAGYHAYFVGGVVRDFYIFPTKVPTDIDISTDADFKQLKRLFPQTASVGSSFCVYLVTHHDLVFEVASFRWESDYRDHRHPSVVKMGTWEQDASRRDFTINAIYFDPMENKCFDFFLGMSHLSAKTIACVGDPICRFEEDYLRMVRLVRFAVNLNFDMAQDTWQAALLLCSHLRELSTERILLEIQKVNEERFLELKKYRGLFRPSFAKLEEVDQELWLPRCFHHRYPFVALIFLFGFSFENLEWGESLSQSWAIQNREKRLLDFLHRNVHWEKASTLPEPNRQYLNIYEDFQWLKVVIPDVSWEMVKGIFAMLWLSKKPILGQKAPIIVSFWEAVSAMDFANDCALENWCDLENEAKAMAFGSQGQKAAFQELMDQGVDAAEAGKSLKVQLAKALLQKIGITDYRQGIV